MNNYNREKKIDNYFYNDLIHIIKIIIIIKASNDTLEFPEL